MGKEIYLSADLVLYSITSKSDSGRDNRKDLSLPVLKGFSSNLIIQRPYFPSEHSTIPKSPFA